MISKTILLTGVTGNLGAYMANQLLLQGHTLIVPVRGRSGSFNIASKRVFNALTCFGMSRQAFSTHIKNDRIKILLLDIVSFNPNDKQLIIPDIDELWHFASSLKYMPKDLEEIHSANVTGLNNIITLFKRFRTHQAPFYYISTAYVVGQNNDTLEESPITLTPERRFTNEYEHSKLLAEELIMAHKDDFFVTIFRPSIVMGTSDTKNLANFNGFYLGLKVITQVNEFLIKANKPDQKIRIKLEQSSEVNLIPLDLVIDRMLAIAACNTVSGAVFNIVNQEQTNSIDIINTVAERLQINLVPVDADAFEKTSRAKIEKLLYYGLNYIMPYIDRKIEFQTNQSAKHLSAPIQYRFDSSTLCQYIDQFLEQINVN